MVDLNAVLFGKVAGLFSLFGYLVYIKAIVWDKTTRPSKTTWFILSPLAFIVYTSAKSAGANETLWVGVTQITGVVTIALLSLKYGESNREKGENLCILGSVISLSIVIFKQSEVALVASLLTESFALWPTIQKSARDPKSEDLFAWLLTQTGNLFNLFAISNGAFGDITYPVWLFILDGVVVYLLIRKRKI